MRKHLVFAVAGFDRRLGAAGLSSVKFACEGGAVLRSRPRANPVRSLGASSSEAATISSPGIN
jgi:hypothetical protein